MTFANSRELRARQLAALRDDLARAETDDERARIEAKIRDVKKFRWSRLFGRLAGHR